MRNRYSSGYTVVELMVTILVATTLITVVGTFFVKLLTIQECDREEAYIRENLVAICSSYADYFSIGTSISNYVDRSGFIVNYRTETGGVSLETGRVIRVSQFVSELSKPNLMKTRGQAIHFNAVVFKPGMSTNDFERSLYGEDTPILQTKDMNEIKIVNDLMNLSFDLTRINNNDGLWYLQVVAAYAIEDDDGTISQKQVSAGRLVRLWNREE